MAKVWAVILDHKLLFRIEFTKDSGRERYKDPGSPYQLYIDCLWTSFTLEKQTSILFFQVIYLGFLLYAASSNPDTLSKTFFLN